MLSQFGDGTASSTPVGPPPTMMKVSNRCRSSGSAQFSACSKANNSRRRMAVASSMRFSPARKVPSRPPEVAVARAGRQRR